MNKITTHILDTSRGRPAEGIEVALYECLPGEQAVLVARGQTNKDGRIGDWPELQPGAGIFKIRFETRSYFDGQSIPTFYPFVEIHFEVAADGHYHIPLLISPFGYSTYRGS
jgi:5-hydroxyisourate hydrolase